MGIIGAYVARIYNEVRARPSYMLSRIQTPRRGDGKETEGK
jgi:hypothetical protein